MSKQLKTIPKFANKAEKLAYWKKCISRQIIWIGRKRNG